MPPPGIGAGEGTAVLSSKLPPTTPVPPEVRTQAFIADPGAGPQGCSATPRLTIQVD